MIGVVVDALDTDPFSTTLFSCLNELSKTRSCYLFTSQIAGMPGRHDFSILQQVYALHHEGPLIATSILSAQVVKGCLTCTDKYYYMRGLDWTELHDYYYTHLCNIMLHPEMKLIAPNRECYDLTTKLFKVPVGTVTDWNPDQLRKVLR